MYFFRDNFRNLFLTLEGAWLHNKLLNSDLDLIKKE